jgi:hypothetical protein
MVGKLKGGDSRTNGQRRCSFWSLLDYDIHAEVQDAFERRFADTARNCGFVLKRKDEGLNGRGLNSTEALSMARCIQHSPLPPFAVPELRAQLDLHTDMRHRQNQLAQRERPDEVVTNKGLEAFIDVLKQVRELLEGPPRAYWLREHKSRRRGRFVPAATIVVCRASPGGVSNALFSALGVGMAIDEDLVIQFSHFLTILSSHCTPSHSSLKLMAPASPQLLAHVATMMVPHSIPSSKSIASSFSNW